MGTTPLHHYITTPLPLPLLIPLPLPLHQCRLKPYQNFHESQKNLAQGKFSNWPHASPSLPSVSGHLAPNRQSEGQEGKIRRAASPPGGRTTRGCATQPQTPTPAHPDKLFASAFLLGSPLLPPLPPAPRRLAVPASFAFSRLTCWILV